MTILFDPLAQQRFKNGFKPMEEFHMPQELSDKPFFKNLDDETKSVINAKEIKTHYNSLIKDPAYIAGFTDGEGSFFTPDSFSDSSIEFSLTQNKIEINLMIALWLFFKQIFVNKGNQSTFALRLKNDQTLVIEIRRQDQLKILIMGRAP